LGILTLFIVLVFGLMVRLGFSTAESTDEWVSFWHMHRQKKSPWLNYKINDSLIPGTRAYPILQHFLVSRFPERYWGILGRFSNALYDVLIGLMVYLTVESLTGNGYHLNSALGISPAAGATLIFLTTPNLFPASGRMIGVKSRSLGLLLTTGFFLLLGIQILYSSWWTIPLLIITGLLIILSSQFATQVMVFFVIFLSVYLFSPVPITIIILTLIIAWFIPAIGAKSVLEFMWHHLMWFRALFARSGNVRRTGTVRDAKLSARLSRGLMAVARFWIAKKSPVKTLYATPILLVIIGGSLANQLGLGLLDAPISPVLGYFWNIVWASVIVYLLILLPPFRFLGEADRYLEYSTPMVAILFIFTLARIPVDAQSELFWVLFLFQLIVIYGNFLLLRRKNFLEPGVLLNVDLEEAIGWCASNVQNMRGMTVPIKLSHILSTQLNGAASGSSRFYYSFLQREDQNGFNYLLDETGGLQTRSNGLASSFDIPLMTPREMLEKYGITHLFIDKHYLPSLVQTWSQTESLLLDSPIFQNKSYLICMTTLN
jgi:hypothetical protein